ncbi:MAG: citrate transporter, partial [Thermoprotei archaeon]
VLRAGSDVFVVTGILIWLSVAVSAVIDNVPYVATMLPVIDIIAEKVHTDPVVIVWSLLLGATLGGGITYIGASANVVGVRILEKKGYQITFYDFIKKSIPFNLANILSGWILYIWLWLF